MPWRCEGSTHEPRGSAGLALQEGGRVKFLVNLPEGTREVELGTRVGELLDPSQEWVGALVDGHVVELTHRIVSDSTVRPLGRADAEGRRILERSASCLLQALLLQGHPGVGIEVGQTLGGQLFYEVTGSSDILELGDHLDAQFQQAVSEDHRFNTRLVPVPVALRVIHDPHGYKWQIMRGWIGNRFGLVTLLDYNDLAYGPYVPSTGFLKGARVRGLPEGLLLQLQPDPEPPVSLRNFLLPTARQTREWNRRMGVGSLGNLNQRLLEGKEQDLVQVAETFHEMRVGALADAIQARPQTRVIFVSGPSSSGKTTFARRLSTRLRAAGLETFFVAMDDYYLDRDRCPVDQHGEVDLEALEALDLTRLGEDLRSLLAGRETLIPRFDFVRQRRADPSEWHRMHLGPGQLLLMEGIHGLNPRVTDAVPPEARYGVFVSALPQLILDESQKVPTTYSRLLRRLIRDRRYRGTSAAETIARWPSVRRGEDKYVFPNQERADGVFNSALAYEVAVFRTFAWPYLLEVPEDHPSYTTARDLLSFLSLVVPLLPDWIPKNSVLREFLGGSTFAY